MKNLRNRSLPSSFNGCLNWQISSWPNCLITQVACTFSWVLVIFWEIRQPKTAYNLHLILTVEFFDFYWNRWTSTWRHGFQTISAIFSQSFCAPPIRILSQRDASFRFPEHALATERTTAPTSIFDCYTSTRRKKCICDRAKNLWLPLTERLLMTSTFGNLPSPVVWRNVNHNRVDTRRGDK